ncbi:MAG: DegT/DnrJ/EryC1/StrS family aminotransferase [bacterium]|nr:DegT/DnrJ/EryC1/StrS family aminotransferase [bacterium]MDZ4285032.1 DegT/DnrJ/EryC1/StrS family aminotransferase [Patescibacteria group bacterium]
MFKRRAQQIGTGGAVISPYAKRLVNRVLDSGRLSYGPYLKRFEREFARMHDRRFGIVCSSGTAALQIALHALKEHDRWKDGDEVLVPAVTFIATSNVVLHNNLRPVFVDIDPTTYNIDPRLIEARITPRTRAIMPVHLFGLSADMLPIRRIARRHNLRIVEDSCETAGVHYRGKPVGSMGDIACYSMYIAHLVTTGVGGMILTNDPELVVRCRSLMNHGRDAIYIAPDDDRGKRGTALQEVVARRFNFVSVGHSHRVTEMEGALGVAQLRELPATLRLRQRHAARLLAGLAPYREHLVLPRWPTHSEHAFMMFPIVVREESPIKRDELVEHLEEWNIETRPIFPLLNQPVYKKLFGDIERDYPVAERIVRDGLFIGCHPEMGREDVEYVLAVFRKFFEGVV